MTRGGRALHGAFTLLEGIAGISVVILMVLTCADIVGRQLHLWTLQGLMELSTITIIVVGFVALAPSFVHDRHIKVDLIMSRLPDGAKRRLDAFWHVMTALLLAGMAWRILTEGLSRAAAGELTPADNWPILVFYAPAAMGAAAAVLACLMRAVAQMRARP